MEGGSLCALGVLYSANPGHRRRPDLQQNGKGPREGPFDSEGRATSETLFPWLVSPQALIGRCIHKHRIS